MTDYLDIEKMRFKDRFDYSIKVDENVNTDWKIPKMIIQIYVENAIKSADNVPMVSFLATLALIISPVKINCIAFPRPTKRGRR